MYSDSIHNLISQLKKLPSVGERTAERYILHWLKRGRKDVDELKNALEELLKNTKSCKKCWTFSDFDPCIICTDKSRDTSVLCVVEELQDQEVIEKTGVHKGLYFILRGVIRPDLKEGARYTKVKELFLRLQSDKNIKEVVLALNSDLDGETTAMYIEKQIKEKLKQIKTTRLARGLPMGSDLQYADEITLGSAFKNRK